MQLITWCEPKTVMLVHGEGEKMKFLKGKIKEEHGVECYMPANGETAVIPASPALPAKVSGKKFRFSRLFCKQIYGDS